MVWHEAAVQKWALCRMKLLTELPEGLKGWEVNSGTLSWSILRWSLLCWCISRGVLCCQIFWFIVTLIIFLIAILLDESTFGILLNISLVVLLILILVIAITIAFLDQGIVRIGLIILVLLIILLLAITIAFFNQGVISLSFSILIWVIDITIWAIWTILCIGICIRVVLVSSEVSWLSSLSLWRSLVGHGDVAFGVNCSLANERSRLNCKTLLACDEKDHEKCGHLHGEMLNNGAVLLLYA